MGETLEEYCHRNLEEGTSQLLGSPGSLLLCPDAQWVKGDSLSPEDQSKVLRGYFIVAHILAPTFPSPQSITDLPSRMRKEGREEK